MAEAVVVGVVGTPVAVAGGDCPPGAAPLAYPGP